MKLLVGLCVFVLVSFSAAAPDGKHMELLKLILKECKMLEGGTDGDIEKLMIGDFPDSEEGHCMMTCVNEKIGVFKDGELNKQGFIDMGKMLVNGDEKMMSFMLEVADECGAAIEGKGRCDMGPEFEKCLHNAVKSRNIDVDMF